MKAADGPQRTTGRTTALAAALCGLLAILLQISAAQASEPRLQVRSAILMDMGTGRVLYEQDADRAIAPASTTKIMTMYLVYEAMQRHEVSMDDYVPITRRADSAGGTRMPVKPGDTPTLNEVMRAMAVVSGNNACVAAAEFVDGDVKDFVRRMNDMARSLGMAHTVFKNPNGLPARGQTTTARDMLVLGARYLKRYPESLRYHSQKAYYYNNYQGHNANTLLGEYEGMDGLKTGFVAASGFNIIATAKRGGTRLIAAVMGADSSRIRARETEKLLDLGFAMVEGDQVRVAHVRESMNPEKPAFVRASLSTKKRGARADKALAATAKDRPHGGKHALRKTQSPSRTSVRADRASGPSKPSAPPVQVKETRAEPSKSVKSVPAGYTKKPAAKISKKTPAKGKPAPSGGVGRLALAVPGS